MAIRRPLLAITLGDPAGIGPEIIVKALSAHGLYELCCPLLVGDARVLSRALSFTGLSSRVHAIKSPADGTYTPGTLDVLDLGNVNPDNPEMGAVSADAGRAAVECILAGTRMAMNGEVDGLVNGPISKEAVKAAGYTRYLGHVSILEDVTGCEGCRPMLVAGKLQVVSVTYHIPLKEVSDHLSIASVLDTITLTHRSLEALGVLAPRIGVSGLNPHNGDGGLVGTEEIEVIAPAVEDACDKGIDACGPVAADSIFTLAVQGQFDVVVCMYHDQGHIAVKAFGFDESVTVTLGLPFVRTTTAHGVAFDLAGKGRANSGNMEEAIRLAARLVGRRHESACDGGVSA
jgi:4-hydroxythreonine-4-phosphate dehydrogenase